MNKLQGVPIRPRALKQRAERDEAELGDPGALWSGGIMYLSGQWAVPLSQWKGITPGRKGSDNVTLLGGRADGLPSQ